MFSPAFLFENSPVGTPATVTLSPAKGFASAFPVTVAAVVPS